MFNFLKSNTVVKVLFALIPVNKDLEYKCTSERKYCLVRFDGKKSVVFGSNSLKMSISFDKNF